MDLRILERSDASAYRDLMLHAYGAAPDAFTSTPEERASAPVSWWEERIAHPEGLSVVFGAFDQGALVGTVALECSARPKTRHKAHLIGLYVRDSARGAGVGAALLRAALAHAWSRPGLACLTLTVTQGNEPALRLYRAFGFAAFGLEPMAVRVAEGFKAKVHLWCDLSRASGEPQPPA